MQAPAYWKAVTADRSEFLERLVALLAESGVRYCVIGGQGVNAYVEPVVSLDLDLAVATAHLAKAEAYPELRRLVPAPVLARLI